MRDQYETVVDSKHRGVESIQLHPCPPDRREADGDPVKLAEESVCGVILVRHRRLDEAAGFAHAAR